MSLMRDLRPSGVILSSQRFLQEHLNALREVATSGELTFSSIGSSVETGNRHHSYQGKIPQMRDGGV
jgi:hypothetical protein